MIQQQRNEPKRRAVRALKKLQAFPTGDPHCIDMEDFNVQLPGSIKKI